MRKLNDSEKEEVKKLLNHKGFKIVEGLFQEFQSNILNKYIVGNLDLKDDKILSALNADKDYLKGAKGFIEIIKSSTTGVGRKNKD